MTPIGTSLESGLCDIVPPRPAVPRGADDKRTISEEFMQHFRAFLALAFAAGLTLTSPAEARLTRLEITKREIVADGMAFGTAGAYEKLTGRAWFEADPTLERNAPVFDL